MTNALHIDTLKFSRKLVAAGMEPAVAEAIAETFVEVDTSQLSTKDDLRASEAATRADIQGLDAATKAEFQAVRAELQALAVSTKAEFAVLRSEMREMENRLVIKTGGMIVGALAILTALMRLIPPA